MNMKLFHRNPTRLADKQQGFTIIELLIATMTFSVILLIITAGVITFSKAYFRGVNSSGLQNTARSISDELSQAIQFSGSNLITDNSTYVCVGGYVYWYSSGVLYTGGTPTKTPSNLGLFRQPASNCSSLPAFNASSGDELLGKNMRVSKLIVKLVTTTPTSTISLTTPPSYTVDIRLAYGEDYALNQPNGTGATCQSGASEEFCAVSELSTVAQKRLQ